MRCVASLWALGTGAARWGQAPGTWAVDREPGTGRATPCQARRSDYAAVASVSCSASMRAFHSRFEACQPSSLWPSRQ